MSVISRREGARNDQALAAARQMAPAMLFTMLEQQRAAYERARAAFDRLQSLTDRWNRGYTSGHIMGSRDEWREQRNEYFQAQKEWDDRFAEFDEAVNEYAATLRGEDSPDYSVTVVPRKPR
jgi:hypothetical protein